jgi:excisionase family DNA binding protein
MANVAQEYYTASQLMRYLGVSRRTFYKLIPPLVEAGKLNKYEISGLSGVRYRKSEVDACFQQANSKGGSDSD